MFDRVLLWKPGARHLHMNCTVCGASQAYFVSLLARCAGCHTPIMPVHAEKRWRIDGGMPATIEPVTMRTARWNDLALVPLFRQRRRRRK